MTMIAHPSRTHQQVSDFIQFFSLRNHGVIGGRPVTEQIYVHSKLIIVDDKKVILGSSNLNDRSMLGPRDSEIAALVQQDKNHLVQSIINGKGTLVSEFAFNLRRELWRRYLGVTCDDKNLIDPVGPECRKLFQVADVNTEVYLQVFGYIPNNIWKFKEISKTMESHVDTENYKIQMTRIRGFLVHYPVDFLKDESLNRSPFSPEILLSKTIYL
eukprot:TRINITY_DN7956_c0_g1_i1.p1 TRINITY_DN7956_c0_g1~~TRINITY_DN7956_c0_g1_i1.p1  ORF type:complete len:214 (-),score=33.24 TRINITY_DN7956_c0_g1_i1:251-892(-)